jgi:hypothetical protein
MTSERQIQANRANALKSTGPRTLEGKRISSKNRSLRALVSGPPVLKGRALRSYNNLAAAFILKFQPRNSVEAVLVQTLTVARWHLQRLWGDQTAGFQRELDRARQDHPSESPAALAAIVFEALTSGPFARQHRLEAYYDRQFDQALAKLLKLRKIPIKRAATQRAANAGANNFCTEANSAAAYGPFSEKDLVNNK